MFTLVTDRSKFFRVKGGQSRREIEETFCVPVLGVFGGAIVSLEGRFTVYEAVPGDTYRSLAARFRLDEEALRRANHDRPVYPTRKLFVPCVSCTPEGHASI